MRASSEVDDVEEEEELKEASAFLLPKNYPFLSLFLLNGNIYIAWCD